MNSTRARGIHQSVIDGVVRQALSSPAEMLRRFGSVLGALCLAILIGSLVFLALGASPVSGYTTILSGALANPYLIGQTLNVWTPLVLTGLAALIPFQAGLWNAGGDGQLYAGAVGAILTGLTFTSLSGPLLTAVILVSAALSGAVWALIPAVLKVTAGANEIVTTLLLNFVAVLLADYVITGRWASGFSQSTKTIPLGAQVGAWISGTNIGLGEVIALCSGALVFLVLTWTKFGFSLKTFGSNPKAAELAGLRPSRVTLHSFGSGGIFAGLAGGLLVVTVHHALVSGISAQYGFIGIAAALLAGLNPLLLLATGFILAVLTVGSSNLTPVLGIDPAAGLVIEAVLVLLLLATGALRLRLWQGGVGGL